MAVNNNNHDQEEASPLLENQEAVDLDNKTVEEPEKKNGKTDSSPPSVPQAALPELTKQSVFHAGSEVAAESYGWTADGLPVGLLGGQPVVGRTEWNSGLLSCFGRQDEFYSSDLEVCLLGTVAPCMLYASNVERIGSARGSFFGHCLTYTALYLIGNSVFGWNCLAPWLSYYNRTAMRRRFNLEGNCETLARSCGCCASIMEDDLRREQCETACDFASHVFCHRCALCQEGREARRRLPHPAHSSQPIFVMIPPAEQTMGRDSA